MSQTHPYRFARFLQALPLGLTEPKPMGYRGGAVFVRDWRQHSRPIDRNERARIIFAAEALERATKAPGMRNGALGYVGMAVLRALLLGFLNRSSGLCCPSYDALQERTGLCRQSIARALKALESAGIVRITRRLCRQRIGSRILTTMATSLYSFWSPLPQSTVKGGTNIKRVRKCFPRKIQPLAGLAEIAILGIVKGITRM